MDWSSFAIPVIVLLLIVLTSHLVSSLAYNRLKKAGNKLAMPLRVLIFIGCALLIIAGLLIYVIHLPFEL